MNIVKSSIADYLQKTNYNNKKVTSTAPLQGLCFFIYNPLTPNGH